MTATVHPGSRKPVPARRGRARWILSVGSVAGLSALLFVLAWNLSWRPWPLRETVDGDAGRYTAAAVVPESRTEAGGAVWEDRLYLAGGIDAFARTIRSFVAYDAATGRWSALPDLPAAISHPGVVAADGNIFVIGGFGPLGLRPRGAMIARWDPLSSTYVYDVAAGTWRRGPDLPEPRGAGGVAVTDDAIWYVGGIDASLGVSADLFRLDLARLVWQRMPAMPTARDHLRMEAVAGMLYAISGRRDDLRFNLPAVERYDIAQGTWSRVADIPVPRGGFGSAVLDGRIYVFGGEHVWSTFDVIERYDPVPDRWESLGAIPEARHGIVGGTIDGAIHMVSGGRHPRVSVSGIHRVLTPR